MKRVVIVSLASVVLLMAAAVPTAAQRANVSVATLDMSAVPHLEREGIRIVQRGLRERGMDPGPIDGVVGPHTRAAVRTYQSRYGMRPSGDLDNQLLFALGDADIALSAAH